MAAHVGWRNFWWLITGLTALNLLCNIFLFAETKFHRQHVVQNGQKFVTAGSPMNKGSQEEVNNTSSTTNTADPEKDLAVHPTNTNGLREAITHQDPWLGRGKPSKQQWKLWQPYEGNIFFEFVFPLYLHIYPIIEFAAFVVSWTASCFLTLNLTQTQAFAAPPYNFDSQAIGFFNFAILIGVLIGLFTAGPLSDWIAAKLTQRNRGIREPEMRLLTMVPYVLIMVLGNAVTACGYQYAWDWRVSGFLSFHSMSSETKSKSLHTLRLSLSLDILVQASKSLRFPLLYLPMPLTHISLWPEASSSPLPLTRTSGVMVSASSSPRGSLQTDTFRPS
jgi:hypothetical protein